jgi:hypothetical protein
MCEVASRASVCQPSSASNGRATVGLSGARHTSTAPKIPLQAVMHTHGEPTSVENGTGSSYSQEHLRWQHVVLAGGESNRLRTSPTSICGGT